MFPNLIHIVYQCQETNMPSKLCMWGNSHGVRLPKYVIEHTGLKAGDYVYVHLENGEIVIRPFKPRESPPKRAANDAELPDNDVALRW